MISKDFSVDHIDLINLKLFYPDIKLVKEEVYPFYDGGDEAKTYIEDDKIIFCCGIKLDGQGIGRAWVIPSVHIDKHKIFFVKTIKKLIEEYSEKMNLRRLYTVVTDEMKDWIEFVGFNKEGELKNFQENGNHVNMYARYF